ncbi:MAG: 3'-5' exonuclease, partial [Bdellovibrio bacteriovorus]
WDVLVGDLIRAWGDEAGAAAVPAAQILEHAYETLAEQRRERSLGGGVLLATLHGAKGLEFPHVLIADGGRKVDQWGEDERRLLYVGMTRACETLTLGFLSGDSAPWRDEIDGDWLFHLRPECAAPPPEVMARRYRLLTPADLDLGFAGRLPPDHPVHARLGALQTGDRLVPRAEGQRVLLCDAAGRVVARLSQRASPDWTHRLPQIESITVVAMLRRLEDGDPAYRGQCRTNIWEVPLVEIHYRVPHGSALRAGPRGRSGG